MKNNINILLIGIVGLLSVSNSYAQNRNVKPSNNSRTEIKKTPTYNKEINTDQKTRVVSPKQVQKSKYTNNAVNYPINAPRPVSNSSYHNSWNQRQYQNQHGVVITRPSENIKIQRNVYDYGRKVTPPFRSKIVYHKGISYRYYNGVYYRPYGDTYIVSRPPVGAVVAAVLLNELVKISVVNNAVTHNYYYDDGTYYIRDVTNNYRVVEAPVGAVVDMLPSGAMEVRINNTTYYMVGDTYYRPINLDGYMRFEVVGGIM
ncbi:MAG: DUF6515 family protein [Flavobacteriales bacterium]|nr:DUF6515 family protein [Flavobacteriales bacterium]